MGVRLDVKKVMPEEDARGLAILEETTKWIDDRYVIGLMWREFFCEECMYVEDYLESVRTEDEAISRVTRLTSLLQRGGFPLTKWMSSSRRVLASIPASETANPMLDLDNDDLPIERTLGVVWDAERDEFTFKIKRREVSITKRAILSDLSQLFDPLGLAAPVVFKAKLIMKMIWESEIGWNDEVSDDILHVCHIHHVENPSRAHGQRQGAEDSPSRASGGATCSPVGIYHRYTKDLKKDACKIIERNMKSARVNIKKEKFAS